MIKIIKSIIKKIARYFNFIVWKKLNGKRFKIPINEGLGFSNLLIEERWMIDLLIKLNKIEANKFVDVGANIGQTLLKIKSIDENIEYIGFEPNSSCVHYLRKLIRINSFNNVILLPIGIDTKTTLKELFFFNNSETDSSASIIDGFRKGLIYKKEFVALYDIKELKSKINLDNMSILKIDVEGAELSVLESFIENIKTSKPFILMEILPVYNEKVNLQRFKRQSRIEHILEDLNYRIFRINKNKGTFFNVDEIQNIGVHSNLNKCDYIFVPKSKYFKFIDLLG